MGVFALLITNLTGGIVFAKYFSSTTNPVDFEKSLLRHTVGYIHNPSKQSVSIREKFVVFEHFGELIVYLVGEEDIDEEILSDLLAPLKKVFMDVLDSRLTAVALQDPENFGKLEVALDEAFPQGIIESCDSETILKMAKMKNF